MNNQTVPQHRAEASPRVRVVFVTITQIVGIIWAYHADNALFLALQTGVAGFLLGMTIRSSR